MATCLGCNGRHGLCRLPGLRVVHTRAALAAPQPHTRGARAADASAYAFPPGACAAEVLPRALVWARVHLRRSGFAPAGFRLRLPPCGCGRLQGTLHTSPHCEIRRPCLGPGQASLSWLFVERR